MTRREKTVRKRSKGEVLDESLGLFSSPAVERMESAAEQVLKRLALNADGAFQENTLPDSELVPSGRFPWAVAAALVSVVVLISMAMLWQGSVPAVLASADGKRNVEYGEIVRSGGKEGAILTLKDGTRVELRSTTELTLEAASDGLRIRLDGGSVIVSAVKQRSGQHLYVQTKDVTVSVVGTVFLVNAEETGSRVAVIEGEVHVQQGPSLRKLLPGEQIATGAGMLAIAVPEEIAWSSEAVMHLALLQQATVLSPQRDLKFAAESIRPHVGLSTGQESIGFLCHGIDGIRREGSEYISGFEGRLSAPQGRCVGKGVLLAGLIAFAYGIPPRDISNLPDWAVLPDHAMNVAQPPANAFLIEAVAEDPSTATAEQLVQMVRTMLADRFNLKVRREPKESQGYALVVAKGGPKPGLKEVSGMEELPCMDFNSAGRLVLRGRSGMDKLALWLGGYLGCLGSVGSPVVDKTGLKGIYEYEFATMGGGGGGGGPRGGPPQGQAPRMFYEVLADSQKQRAANFSDLIELHLGLRLQEEKNIPVESIVIDRVEKPSPN